MTAERMKPVLRAKATSNKNRKDRADGEKHNIFSITRFRHCTVEVEVEDLWIIGAVSKSNRLLLELNQSEATSCPAS
jgi:hypothetical protein